MKTHYFLLKNNVDSEQITYLGNLPLRFFGVIRILCRNLILTLSIGLFMGRKCINLLSLNLTKGKIGDQKKYYLTYLPTLPRFCSWDWQLVFRRKNQTQTLLRHNLDKDANIYAFWSVSYTFSVYLKLICVLVS